MTHMSDSVALKEKASGVAHEFICDECGHTDLVFAALGTSPPRRIKCASCKGEMRKNFASIGTIVPEYMRAGTESGETHDAARRMVTAKHRRRTF